MSNAKRLILGLVVLVGGLGMMGCSGQVKKSPVLKTPTELTNAISENNIDVVKSILGKKPELVNSKGTFQLSDFEEVAPVPSFFTVEMDPVSRIPYIKDITPFDIALLRGNNEILEILITAGANINFKYDDDYGTPLHLACLFGYKDTVKLLIDNGADVNAKTKNGFTPMNSVFSMRLGGPNGRYDKMNSCDVAEDICKTLLLHGADVSGNEKSRWSPLFRAVQRRCKDLVELLILNGADVTVRKDVYGFGSQIGPVSPFDCSLIMTDDIEIMKLLLIAHNGADITTTYNDGTTPLMRAIGKRLKDIPELLIYSGVDVNAKNRDGHTALHSVSSLNQIGRVELLISAGADVNAKNKKGKTPLSLAIRMNSKELISLLKKHGAVE